MSSNVWTENDNPKDKRHRAIRVEAIRRDLGTPARVKVNVMISDVGAVLPLRSLAQSNLTPTNARVLAHYLETAAQVAEETDYGHIVQAYNTLLNVADRDIVEGIIKTLQTTIQKIDDGEL